MTHRHCKGAAEKLPVSAFGQSTRSNPSQQETGFDFFWQSYFELEGAEESWMMLWRWEVGDGEMNRQCCHG